MNGSYRRYRCFANSRKYAPSKSSKLCTMTILEIFVTHLFSKNLNVLENLEGSRKYMFSKVLDFFENAVFSKNFELFRKSSVLENFAIFRKPNLTKKFWNYTISKFSQKSKYFLSCTREKIPIIQLWTRKGTAASNLESVTKSVFET